MSDNNSKLKSIFPTRLFWNVDGKDVEVRILASHGVITAEMVLQNFKNGLRPFVGESAQQQAVRQVHYALDKFLSSELEFDRLESSYDLSLKQLLEL